MLTIWDKDNSLKFKKMLTKKVPLLFVVRDPISHIRGEINHPSNRYVSNIVRNFNLTYKNTINQLIPKAEYRWGLDYKPSFNFLLNNASEFLLDNTDSFISLTSLLAKDTLLDTFKDNISFVYCVEFNDMKADKAFDTFCEIAKKFNLKQPKNKEFFADKQWTEIYTLLPATLYIHPDDLKKNERNLDSITNKDSIQIIITLPSHLSEEQKRFVNIGLILEDNLIIDETRVLIIIKEEDLNKLKENSELYKATIKFLKDYINAIRNEVDRRKEDKITEKQILEFLCQNDKIRKNIKQILDNELNYIKANHPSFIQKWKYYLEFEKMCQELDKD